MSETRLRCLHSDGTLYIAFEDVTAWLRKIAAKDWNSEEQRRALEAAVATLEDFDLRPARSSKGGQT